MLTLCLAWSIPAATDQTVSINPAINTLILHFSQIPLQTLESLTAVYKVWATGAHSSTHAIYTHTLV